MKKIIAFISLIFISYFSIKYYQNQKIKTQIELQLKAKADKKKVKIAGMGIGSESDPNNLRNWSFSRLVNPEGKIPDNIRAKELEFAQTLPQNSKLQTNWIARGPYNVGGRTRAMAIDVTDENTIMAGGVSGGVWRSEDKGDSWTKLTSPEMLHNVTCLRQDTREGHTETWYYGSGEAYGNSASGNDAYFFGNGIYKSNDNGETWNSLTSTASNTPEEFDEIWDLIWDIEIDPSNDSLDIIYAATYGAIHRSQDEGENWTRVLGSESNSAYFSEIEVSTEGVVYASLSSDGTDKGIWRSENGIEWNNILPEDWPYTYDRIKMAINPHNENELYFIAVTPNAGQASITFSDETEHCSLWKYNYSMEDTTSQMGVWEDLSSNIPTGIGSNFDNFYAQGSYNLTIAISPFNENHIFLGGTNLYISTDGFTTMDNINQIGGYQKGTNFPDFQIYDTHHPDQHEVAFLPSSPNSIINANDGGLFISDNYLAEDVEWNSLNNGYYSTQLYTVTINEHQATNGILGGFQDNGNFYTNSEDPNTPWVMPLNGDGAFAHFTADEEVYYMSIQNGKVYKITIDENGNRTGLRRIDPIGPEEQMFIHPFVVDPVTDNIMYYPDETKIWRHSNLNDIELTNEWDSIIDEWIEAIDLDLSGREISCISTTKANPSNRLYVGTNRKQLYRVDDANSDEPIITEITKYFDSSAGMVSGDYFHAYGHINNIAVHPNDGNVALTVFSNYEVYSMYYTTNGGETWSRAGGNLEQQSNGGGNGPSFRWASIMPFGEDTLYFLATSTGLYGTNKIEGQETKWEQMGANTIGNVVCEQVKTRAEDSLVVLATHGNGVYTTKIQSVNDVIEIAEFEPENNIHIYPNPASEYLIIETNKEELYEIYDLQGKLIYKNKITVPITKVNVAAIPKGIYIIKVGELSRKWVKKD